MSKKQQIIEMFEQGKDVKEIAKKVDSFESNVYIVISNYKKEKRLAELELKVK